MKNRADKLLGRESNEKQGVPEGDDRIRGEMEDDGGKDVLCTDGGGGHHCLGPDLVLLFRGNLVPFTGYVSLLAILQLAGV